MNVRIGTPTSSGRAKRVVIELFSDVLPLTAENFRCLCTGEKSTESRKLEYAGSRFHRVIAGKCVQGGDFTAGNGTGGTSVYGGTPDGDVWGKFRDESFRYGHERGCLSMANSGPNTNGSQFFVCLKRMSGWDGKHVVFGRVVSGLRVFDDVCKKVKVDAESMHRVESGYEVVIESCGEMASSYVPPPLGPVLEIEESSSAGAGASSGVAA